MRRIVLTKENNNIHYINICFPFYKEIGEISKELKMLMFLFNISILFKCILLMLKNKIKVQIQQWTATHSPKSLRKFIWCVPKVWILTED